MSFNKIFILGNLGNDPKLRKTQNGTPVASFSVATTETFKDKDGAKQEKTEWFNITAWSRQAENCDKFLKKGSKVLIEGSVRTESYEKDGEKRQVTKILAQKVTFLDTRKDKGAAQAPSNDPMADIPF